MATPEALTAFFDWLRNGPPQESAEYADTSDVWPPAWPQYKPLLVASVDSTGNGFTLIPGVMGARIRLWGWHLSNGAAADRDIRLRWDVSLQQIVRTYLVFNGGQSNFYLWGKSILGPYGEGVQAVLNAAGQTYATAFYTLEDRPEAVA